MRNCPLWCLISVTGGYTTSACENDVSGLPRLILFEQTTWKSNGTGASTPPEGKSRVPAPMEPTVTMGVSQSHGSKDRVEKLPPLAPWPHASQSKDVKMWRHDSEMMRFPRKGGRNMFHQGINRFKQCLLPTIYGDTSYHCIHCYSQKGNPFMVSPVQASCWLVFSS